MLVNGIPSGTQNPSTLDLNSAEQIEILKGPYSSFFGSGAMAGVINIVTPRSQGRLKGNAGLSAGSFGTFSAKAGLGGNILPKLNFDVSVKAYRQGKDYKTGSHNLLNTSAAEKEILDNTYGKKFENTRYDKYNADFRLGYLFPGNWQTNLYQNIFIANRVLTNGNFWGVYGSDEKDIHRWSQSLSVEGSQGRHSIRFVPYLNNEDVNYYNNISDTNYVTTSYNLKSYGFILQDAIMIGNHRVIIGLDNRSEKYVNKRWSTADKRQAPYQPDYSNIGYGFFLQTRFSLLKDRLITALGLRYDFIRFKTFKTDYIKASDASENYQTVNPNISVRYLLLPGLNILAGAGTAFLAPDAFKKTGNYLSGTKLYLGNPNLDPETSFSYEGGLLYTNQSNGISVGATWFDTKQNGLLVYDRSRKDTVSYKNADDSRMNGLEFSAGYDLGNLWNYKYSLKLYGSLTHMLKSEVTYDGNTSDMKYVRKNNASVGIEFSKPNIFALRLHGRYIGHRLEDNWLYGYDSQTNSNIPLTTSDGTPIRAGLINESVLEHPDFLVFDFYASYTLVKHYTLSLSVQNLFDENYTEKDTYNMPGRMITGTISYSF
jgi:vitamin B12 transporter